MDFPLRVSFSQMKCHINWSNYTTLLFFLSFGATAPQWAMAYSFTRFLDHTQRRNTFGRTPLDE